MNKEEIIEASKLLFNHKLNKTGLESLDHLVPKNIEDAYKIQDELKVHYLSLKNNICIGKKIGCTSKVAQTQMNVTEPFYGNLFSKYSSQNEHKLNSNFFFKPFVEPEISFRVKEDIDISKAPYTLDNIKNLLDGILCSIEIVDFRFQKPLSDIGVINLITTNGASDYWIHNDKIFNVDEIDLSDFEVSLFIDNELQEKGNTKNVLDNPLNAVLWLINTLCIKGEPMLKHQFISSGSCTKAYRLNSGKKIKADFGKLGTIEFDYI
tara:strand:- start:2004 stop:2798 length:795 start_codon:yes stop_codon:yes gene_type:complete